MWHFLSCSLAAVQGFLGSLEEDRERMLGAVERHLDQRQVISIRTGCLSTAFLWVAPRGGSLLCLQEALWLRGSLGMGHTLNRHRQERLGPVRCHWRFPGRSWPNTRAGNRSQGSQACKQDKPQNSHTCSGKWHCTFGANSWPDAEA